MRKLCLVAVSLGSVKICLLRNSAPPAVMNPSKFDDTMLIKCVEVFRPTSDHVMDFIGC
jgi:hypothetical protein